MYNFTFEYLHKDVNEVFFEGVLDYSNLENKETTEIALINKFNKLEEEIVQLINNSKILQLERVIRNSSFYPSKRSWLDTLFSFQLLRIRILI